MKRRDSESKHTMRYDIVSQEILLGHLTHPAIKRILESFRGGPSSPIIAAPNGGSSRYADDEPTDGDATDHTRAEGFLGCGRDALTGRR